jgi:hypothetical protein
MAEETMNSTAQEQATEAAAEVRTYSQEEFDAALQRETDRRVTEAMKKAERKKEAAVKEAEKLARMNEDERYQHELEQRELAIAEKEKQLAMAENRATASDVLASKGISTKLVSLVLAEDAEDMMDNIKVLEQEFNASVKAEVEKRLASSTPKKNLPPDGNITRESFRQMSFTQQAELFRTNPDLYKTLSQK